MRLHRPSRVQREVLRRMADGLPLQRLTGGYWTTIDDRRQRGAQIRDAAPSWSVGFRTVQSMQARGWLQIVGPPAWNTERILTDVGRAMAHKITHDRSAKGVGDA